MTNQVRLLYVVMLRECRCSPPLWAVICPWLSTAMANRGQRLKSCSCCQPSSDPRQHNCVNLLAPNLQRRCAPSTSFRSLFQITWSGSRIVIGTTVDDVNPASPNRYSNTTSPKVLVYKVIRISIISRREPVGGPDRGTTRAKLS